MERIGYTRLYATASGVLLVLLGLFGFLYNAEFSVPEISSRILGVYTVNGWANAFHIVIGLVALIMSRRFSRPYALLAAILFLGLGFWGVAAADGQQLFSKLPAQRSVNVLNLLLGLAALACFVAATWKPIRAWFSARIESRRKRTSRRERRRRMRRTKKRAGSKTAS
ncbi:MAG: DUF4383 domain-containing protein [Solirubrobacterales bacterium]